MKSILLVVIFIIGVSCRESKRVESSVDGFKRDQIYSLIWIEGIGSTDISRKDSRVLRQLLSDKNRFGESVVVPVEFRGVSVTVERHVPVALLTEGSDAGGGDIHRGMVSESGICCDISGVPQLNSNEQELFDEVMKKYLTGTKVPDT